MTNSGRPLFADTNLADLTSSALALANLGVSTRNLTATTDPGVSNDSSQGYTPGSVWLNTTLSRVWMCLSNAVGAATWLLDGVVPGVGIEPSTMTTQFGNGTATFLEEGNVFRSVSGAGVSPGSTGNDNVLATFTLPANSFDVANRGLTITAAGSFAATGNNKTLKIIVNCTTATLGSGVTGGTTIATSGVVATNGGGWEISGNYFKYGAAASNTQLGTSNGAIAGASHLGTSAPVLVTATESGAILIAVTGNAATATTDIVLNWCEINAMN